MKLCLIFRFYCYYNNYYNFESIILYRKYLLKNLIIYTNLILQTKKYTIITTLYTLNPYVFIRTLKEKSIFNFLSNAFSSRLSRSTSNPFASPSARTSHRHMSATHRTPRGSPVDVTMKARVR